MIWKVYYWLMFFFIIISMPVFLSETGWEVHIADLVNLGLMIVGLVGLYNYAFKRKQGSREFWIIVLAVSLVYQIAYSFFLDQKYGSSPAASTGEGLITFLPLIPMFIALALYIKRLPSRN